MTEERCAKGRESTEPPARANKTGPVHRAAERQDLRTRIVRRGVRAVCGPSTAVPTSAAANIPLFSASLRFAWLKVLGAAGIRNFVTTSGLGFDFVCHVGDLSEHPFYHRRAYESELALCAAWLHDENEPVVFDIGANVGFVSTQLAQMLAARSPTIYAFEPVPTTFAKLVQTVHRLGLNDRVHPIPAAVLDDPRQVCLSYSLRNSLYAQITPHGLNPRVGDHLAYAPGVTLDGFCSLEDVRPALLKIDVEGSEVAVLRGAPRLLSRRDRPAILLEYNPVTLSECGANGRSLGELLSGYALHYVDDLEGQIMSFGSPVSRIDEITWICNLFAVPLAEDSSARWASALKHAVHRLEGCDVVRYDDSRKKPSRADRNPPFIGGNGRPLLRVSRIGGVAAYCATHREWLWLSRFPASWQNTWMIQLRDIRQDELPNLVGLCLRSKAVWGYDDAFMTACRTELTLRPDELLSTHLQVAERDTTVVGLAQVKVTGTDADLLKLFVEPAQIRSGVGRLLFG